MLAPTPPQPPQLCRNKTSAKSDHSPSLLIPEYINLPVRGDALQAVSLLSCAETTEREGESSSTRGVRWCWSGERGGGCERRRWSEVVAVNSD